MLASRTRIRRYKPHALTPPLLTHKSGLWPQMQEVCALLAATAASEAWQSGGPGAAAQALGGVELAFMLGFNGKPCRDCYQSGAATGRILSALQAKAASKASGGKLEIHAVWLRRRLEVLFPLPPRVTFQALPGDQRNPSP